MSDLDTAAKGRRAGIELRETEEAFDRLRAAMLNEIAATSPENERKILKLHAAVQTLGAVRSALIGMVQNGQIAEQALAQNGLNRG